MSKFWKILSLLILFSIGLTYFPQPVSAASCNFTYDPTVPNQNMRDLTVKITSSDLAPNKYRLDTRGPSYSRTIENLNFSPDLDKGVSATLNYTQAGWKPGIYNLYFILQGKKYREPKDAAACSTQFTINETSAQQTCKATIPNKPIEPGTEVILHVEGLEKSNQGKIDTGTGGYDISISDRFKLVYSTDNGPDISLGSSFDQGTYLVEVRNRCGLLGTDCAGTQPPRLQCNPVAFKVEPKGSGGGGEISPEEAVPQATPCTDPKECTSSGKDLLCDNGTGIKTAIGCVHTSPVGFIKDFLRFIIGISGGLAFLLMLLGAFQMVTSAGNPETLQAGRDRFQSAIIGLLFVIFAVLLLQIIGVGILDLGKQFGEP